MLSVAAAHQEVILGKYTMLGAARHASWILITSDWSLE
jgi:hypothetical protein